MRYCKTCNVTYVPDAFKTCINCKQPTEPKGGDQNKPWIDQVEDAINSVIPEEKTP